MPVGIVATIMRGMNVFGVKIPMHQSSKNDFYVMPKVEYYNSKRAYVQKHVEKGCCLKTQEMLGNSQVSCAGDRQPLREALN